MTTRALFLINGLGLGNSTRCHAIIQRLRQHDVDIGVVTSGNGLWYFDGRPEIGSLLELHALRYGQIDGQLSILRTLTNSGRYLRIMRRNAELVAAVLDRVRPNVVVTDSVYNLAPMQRRCIPVIALNNADVVRHAFRAFTDRPRSIYPQFYAIELMDYLFHRFRPDRVISPSIDPHTPSPSFPFQRVGPIVRIGYESKETSSPTRKVVIMLSGSVFGMPVTLTRSRPGVRIDVVGRPPPDGWSNSDGLYYHGRVRDTAPILADADLVVVNGGFSAVSELFWMKKPMLVVPVPNHAEQWINARTVKKMGVGDLISEKNIEAAIWPALDRISSFRAAYDNLPPSPDGAQQASEVILKVGAGPNL